MHTKKITEMSDREYRAYKWKRRRQRAQRRRAVLLAMMLCVVVFGVVGYCSTVARAGGEGEASYKYYTGVIVKSGDSLWSMSDSFIDDTHYRSKEAYVAEVCSINQLYDASDIRPGQRIIFPYYSGEFVQ
ncbi:MAG: LysM peptidoglycan-binding domain-containing protein [Lachnospiraceae bacterium]|nr:LysM peptidoglycan-binding domain-containing protein [Lachnospiraceae bacterium]